MRDDILLEHRALMALDRLQSGQRVEDDLVELKATWGDPVRAARRIAAMANASRGQVVMWMVGMNEDGSEMGARSDDFAQWWDQVRSCFDGDPPVPRLLTISSGVQVLGLDPIRPPYVVRNPAFGVERGDSVKWEVPWREGTATRTAGREDLVRLLVPATHMPHIDVIEARSMSRRGNTPTGWITELSMHFYVSPGSRDPITIVTQRSRITSTLGEFGGPWVARPHVSGRQSDGTPNVTFGHNEILYSGPGPLPLAASHYLDEATLSTPTYMESTVALEVWPYRDVALLTLCLEFVQGKGDVHLRSWNDKHHVPSAWHMSRLATSGHEA